MDDKKIAIFPASGKLGRSLLRHISEAIDPNQLVLITRFPSKLDNYRDSGAIVRQADYDAPETLENVFSGANTLFLISYASFEHEHRSKAHRTAIDCARRSGVKHIFYSSLAYGAGGGFSKAHVMQAHLDTERYLAKISDEDASFSYTCIREGLYSESFPIYTAFFSLKHPLDEIRIPHNGQAPGIAWAKIDELGEASAAILLSSFHATHDEVRDKNRTILLSGPREWSLTETVQLLGRVIGKEVKICEVTVEEYVTQPHVSEAHTIKGKKMGREWATAFEAIRDGEASIVTLSLKEILGREPEDFETTTQTIYLTPLFILSYPNHMQLNVLNLYPPHMSRNRHTACFMSVFICSDTRSEAATRRKMKTSNKVAFFSGISKEPLYTYAPHVQCTRWSTAKSCSSPPFLSLSTRLDRPSGRVFFVSRPSLRCSGSAQNAEVVL